MNPFPWWARFKGRMLAFGVTMSIIPLVALGYFSISAVWNGQLSVMAERNQIVATMVADDLSRLVSRIDDRLAAVTRTQDEALLDAPYPEKQRILYSLLQDAPYLEEVAVVDGGGRELARASRRLLTGPTELRRLDDEVASALTRGQRAVGRVYIGEDGRPMLDLGVPAHSAAGGSLPGGLKAQVSLRTVLDNLASVRSEHGANVLVVCQNGRLIGHSDFSQVLGERDVSGSLAVQQFVGGADPKGNLPHRYRSYSGQDVIGVFARVPGFPWGVVVEEPVAMALGPVSQMAGRIGLTALIIMSLVAGLSIYFANRVTRPIEVLEEGARRVGNGELDHVIQADSPDEIGRLVAEFNRMTARLRVQSENLRREKERLDLVVSGIGAGLALIGGNGETLWVNRTLAEWLPHGYSPVGRPCYEVLGRTDCAATGGACGHRAPRAGEPATGGPHRELVRTDRSSDGRERILRHRSFALDGGPGEPRFLEVVEDITQQKRMEALVVQADKLAALGQLAAGVAHEINNPLASVAAYAEDLMDRLRDEGPDALVAEGTARGYLSTIRQQVERCKGITSNLLQFARQTPPGERRGPEAVPVNETLKDTLALAGHRIRRQGVQVRWRLSNDVPPAWAERARLQQVFLNLVTNALDAMEPRGGTLTLTTEPMGGAVLVRVADTGQGIPEDIRPRVFEPFFTTKPPGKGTGLGLSICYGIISEWGGHISLDSAPGQGTEVVLTLPALAAGDPAPDGGKDQ